MPYRRYCPGGMKYAGSGAIMPGPETVSVLQGTGETGG